MTTTGTTGTLARVGVGGTINGYGVLVVGDLVVIERDGTAITRRTVDGLGRFVTGARDLALGWGQFPDQMEVIYLYDKDDACFGYAVNLDWPDGSDGDTRPPVGRHPPRLTT
jgi:hypothetical protein